MPREYTEEEVRQMFIDKVKAMAHYWLNEKRTPDTKEKLEGLAFSILNIIDGGTELPPFILAPISTEEDKLYHIENDEDYFPENCDIAGSLHELFFKHTKKLDL